MFAIYVVLLRQTEIHVQNIIIKNYSYERQAIYLGRSCLKMNALDLFIFQQTRML